MAFPCTFHVLSSYSVQWVLIFILPYMELYGLSLQVPHSKFILCAVSPKLRNYDVVERAMNHELRNYYIDVSDRCPTIVDPTAVQYCTQKNSSQVLFYQRCTNFSQIVQKIWKFHPAWLPPFHQKSKNRNKKTKMRQVVHLRIIHFIQMVQIFHSKCISFFAASHLIFAHFSKVWWSTCLTKPLRLSSGGRSFVRKSASFSWVLTYAVHHLSLAGPSRTKWYANIWLFFFKVESGMVVFSRTD